ncbi:MAG: efflux RND transporter periplasmic adaptor subunit [Calditrichaeota bacterium]|nr:MAG: efflux RND transporter periplasmic adaptor subunit [Calditrichota bacterium]
MCVLLLGFAQLDCGNEEARSANGTSKSAHEDTTVAKKAKGEHRADKKKPEELVPVETTKARVGEISSYLLLSSNLETERMTDVYSRVQGLVEATYVDEGDYVKKGQVLLSLEAEEYALAEAKARVEYEQQKSVFQRSEAMFNKQLLSKEEFDQAKYTLEARKIQWQQAKLNLDYTKITAPISGVVGERLARQGDRIQPSDKLFTVIDAEEMIAVVHVPEKELGVIEKGQPAFITSAHLQGTRFAGWIKRVSPVVDPQSGTFKVTVGVRNKGKRLRPGMFVNVNIITDTHKNAVLVPKTALLYENEKMYAFVVRDSVAHKIEINAGYQDYENVEALTDIQPDDDIIVVGQAGLKDQTRVKIVAQR